jgi:hypothetical protein
VCFEHTGSPQKIGLEASDTISSLRFVQFQAADGCLDRVDACVVVPLHVRGLQMMLLATLCQSLQRPRRKESRRLFRTSFMRLCVFRRWCSSTGELHRRPGMIANATISGFERMEKVQSRCDLHVWNTGSSESSPCRSTSLL